MPATDSNGPSQFEALEEPAPEEAAITADTALPVEHIVEHIIAALGAPC